MVAIMRKIKSLLFLLICMSFIINMNLDIFAQKEPVKGIIRSEEIKKDYKEKKKPKRIKKKRRYEDYNNNILIGAGFGIGFFYPGDVNDYMVEYADFHNYYLQEGITELIMNIVGRVNISYRLNNYLEFAGMLEYGWGPKYIMVTGDEDVYFHFDRISPGLLTNFHIPFASGRHSFFIGAGIFYHMMEFEQFSDNAIGYRAQAGINLRLGRFTPQVFLAYDYALGEDTIDYIQNSRIFELNYSGIVIGITAMFAL